MNNYDLLRLAMFSGKGGVGKTTLACAFARHWAQRFPQERILLVSTDPAHSLGDVLQATVDDIPRVVTELPNLQGQALNAEALLQTFRQNHGEVLQCLVERGSFVQGDDLTPVWDLAWPGLDELMGVLELQRILRDGDADRVVVDMAPSGHTLNLFRLMDFLDGFLNALTLFQEKHRAISQSFTGRYTADEADEFLTMMRTDLTSGRQLLQDPTQTACLIVAIPEPMSYLETRRFLESLHQLNIPVGGLFVNRFLLGEQIHYEHNQVLKNNQNSVKTKDCFLTRSLNDIHSESINQNNSNQHDINQEQNELLSKFIDLVGTTTLTIVPLQRAEPVGTLALDQLFAQLSTQLPPQLSTQAQLITDHDQNDRVEAKSVSFPEKIPPGFSDFIVEGRRLILVGGKGGVGKTTVAAAIGLGMAERHPESTIRVISIDPAHSLGDAFGVLLNHEPTVLRSNLSGQEIDANRVLDQFRQDYLRELADMMSGDVNHDSLQIAYAPEAWRQIVAQALPGIDEMLSLITVMELLERGEQDLIILDMAPTGHLLRFLEMPTALANWLAWIFKLWIKYQDVVGRTELMGRLRSLRQRVVQAQKKLTDPTHTELIGVVQAQSAVIAEAERLTQELAKLGMYQRYVVHNRYQSKLDSPSDTVYRPSDTVCSDTGYDELLQSTFPAHTLVRLPNLPRAIAPSDLIAGAAHLLFT